MESVFLLRSLADPVYFSFTRVLFQLVNQNWGGEMRDGYWLGKDYPGVYQGERQALNDDYTHSGFDRGHLNPNGHHAGTYCFLMLFIVV